MNVFITGIRGFLASHLTLFLQNQGYTVSGFSSRMIEPTSSPPTGEKIFQHKLGDPFEEAMFTNMDAVIHCAHDFQKGALRKNIEGTIALAEAADKQGVGQQIFISSLSSRPDAQSEYGKAKFEIEQYFKIQNGLIVRPGTVLGPGGIFAKMAILIKRLPVLPLLDSGLSQMYVIGVDDLCRAIGHVLKSTIKNLEYNLYYPEKMTLKGILTPLRRLLRRHTLFIPVPSSWLILPLSLLGSMGLRLPVDIENLRGFIKSQNMIYPSDLHQILDSYSSIEEILQKYFPAED